MITAFSTSRRFYNSRGHYWNHLGILHGNDHALAEKCGVEDFAHQNITPSVQICSSNEESTRTELSRAIFLHDEIPAVLIDDGDHAVESVFSHVLLCHFRPAPEHLTAIHSLGSRSRCLQRQQARSASNIQYVGLAMVRIHEVLDTSYSESFIQDKPVIAALYTSLRRLSLSIDVICDMPITCVKAFSLSLT